MFDIIELDSDTWSIQHNFNRNLEKNLRFADSTTVFHVLGQIRYVDRGFLLLTVTAVANSPISYTISYRIRNLNDSSETVEDELTETQVACTPCTFPRIEFCDKSVSIELKLTSIKTASIGGLFSPFSDDLKLYVERGPSVTLVGADGNVTVPRRILKLRSKALEVILSHGSKEKETG